MNRSPLKAWGHHLWVQVSQLAWKSCDILEFPLNSIMPSSMRKDLKTKFKSCFFSKICVSCEYISSYNIHRWHTILTYTHKHITWTRAYTNTCVPQLKMSRKRSTIIKLVMHTHTIKPSPLHSENLGRC
jgi:hypothetical protein